MNDSTARAGRKSSDLDSSRRVREKAERLLGEFRKAKNSRLQSSESKDNPELVYLEKVIREFETDLKKSLS